MEAKNNARIADVQSKIEDLDKQIPAAPRSKRDALVSRKQALPGELALDKAIQEVIQKRSAFMESSTDTAAEGLEGRISQLARSVASVLAPATPVNEQKSVTQPKTTVGVIRAR